MWTIPPSPLSTLWLLKLLKVNFLETNGQNVIQDIVDVNSMMVSNSLIQTLIIIYYIMVDNEGQVEGSKGGKV